MRMSYLFGVYMKRAVCYIHLLKSVFSLWFCSHLKRKAGLSSMKRGCFWLFSAILLTKQKAQKARTFCNGSAFSSFSPRISLIYCSCSSAILALDGTAMFTPAADYARMACSTFLLRLGLKTMQTVHERSPSILPGPPPWLSSLCDFE